MPTPTILIVTANDAEGSLSRLSDEAKEIQRILNSVPEKAYEIILLPSAKIVDIIEVFKVPNRIIEVFHYAGHADGATLQLKDDDASARDLAAKIQSAGTVKFVFLNGCATMGQVNYFHTAGVPLVLATSRKVGDERAYWLATQFYAYLLSKQSVQKAWKEVRTDANLLHKNIPFEISRHVYTRKEEANTSDLAWRLYQLEDREQTDYNLPFLSNNKITTSLSHTIFLEKLIFALDDLDNPALQQIQKLGVDIKRAIYVSDNKKISALLEVLPYPIGIRLRKIIAKPEQRSNDYYRELLYDYAFFFETLLYQTFALLSAKIWQDKEKAFVQLPDKMKTLQNFLRQNRLSETPDTYVDSIHVLTDWLRLYNPNAIPFTDDFLNYLYTDSFQEATRFFFLQKRYFQERIRLEEENALHYCALSQQYINASFPEFTFLLNYVMASVRGIKVKNFRHLPTDYAPIENIVSNLFVSDAEPSSLPGQEMMENKFVLSFYKSKPSIGLHSLNLFPFIIDRNVFTGKPNDEVDLYLLIGIFATPAKTEAFHFVSIENPGEVWRFDPTEQQVSLLHTHEETTLIHEQNHLMADAWEFKNYLAEYQSQFLQRLQS